MKLTRLIAPAVTIAALSLAPAAHADDHYLRDGEQYHVSGSFVGEDMGTYDDLLSIYDEDNAHPGTFEYKGAFGGLGLGG